MPSGCAALPAKKTTDAEGPCMRLAQSYHAFDGSAAAEAETASKVYENADHPPGRSAALSLAIGGRLERSGRTW